MRITWARTIVGVVWGLLASVSGAEAQGQLSVGGAPVQTQIVVGENGETFVGVWIQAPNQAPPAAARPPMAISLVIDTSGSMAGDKIANARVAAAGLLESLRDGDIVSIYSFSYAAYEIAPPTIVGPGTRAALMRSVQGLEASGNTALYAGLEVGIARIAQAPASHTLRRIFLISDGQANVGPSDPQSLGVLAARGTETGMQVTAIGVGLDYDEQTLGSIAVRSSGRLYHLAQPSQMASILRDEVGLLASTVATNVYIEIVPAPGVVILEGLTMGSVVENGRLRIPVGVLQAGQQREVLFKARVDTRNAGERPLATARVVYNAPNDRAERQAAAAIPVTVTRDGSAAQRSQSPRVVAMVAAHDASRAQLRAAEALNRGDTAAATAGLAQAENELMSAAARTGGATGERLRQEAGRVREIRSRAAGAATPAARRGAALEANDSAYEMNGY